MGLLEVHNFSVKFKIGKDQYFDAVKNISFSINAGEILGLIGESGSGKSVASQNLTKLQKDAITTGKVIYNGSPEAMDILTCSDKILQEIRSKEISYIFQEPMTALNPLIKCGKQILEGIETANDKSLEELLLKVELLDFNRIAQSYPHELSGGQRQRVMIAMALAKKPKLLIADEPTTALDVAIQNDILSLLKKICTNEKMAVLFITHDLLSLAGFADKIAVMYKGEIVEINSAKTLLTNPKHPYTNALIQSRADYDKKGNTLAEIDDLLNIDGDALSAKKFKASPLPSIQIGEEILALKQIFKSHYKKSLFSKQETQVLKEVSFKLNKGDSLGLIGESGSGKSTIAKLILKVWKQSKGEISLYGKPLMRFDDLSKEIQLVFQDPFSSLNPKHSIGKAISEVLISADENRSKEKTLALLQEVGLSSSDFNKYPHEFSGGQRQRICIAKALAKNPKIVVLDEAVSALDVSVQAKVLNLLNKLKQQKELTYLLISHDMNVVSYFCNKLIVLKNGEIVEMGLTQKLIEEPASEYTKSLLEHSIN